jgi:hypothetical protein
MGRLRKALARLEKKEKKRIATKIPNRERNERLRSKRVAAERKKMRSVSDE